MMVLAAVLAAIALPGAAAAATPDLHAGEICAVDGLAVDPRFCFDDIPGTARWIDPLATGGTSEIVPGAAIEVPANPTGHADGLRVEGIRP
jgi:hypothetical protein